MQKGVTFLFFIVAILSCEKNFYPDDELSLPRTNFNGNSLRTDGVYYRSINEDSAYVRLFLYNNGIVKFLFRSSEIEKDLHPPIDLKDMWGIFLVENNDITIEEFVESNSPSYHVYTSHGMVINDTTFQLTESYRLKKGEKTNHETINRIYHFHKYSPKPDSINEFIK